ncbi:MAG TPA: SDR family oxidoreductase [Haliangium sp.]|nr:SDR family oxidoreductase [Haliangium sp.]
MILITGATGTIGRELVELVSAAGMHVRAMARQPQRAAVHDRARGRESLIDWVHGDLTAPETLPRALDGVERAFLLSPADPRQAELEEGFIAAARAAGVAHVVKLSARGAALDASFPGGRLHARIERALERSGLAFTHLRPHFFMQNLLRSAAAIRDQGKIFAPMADARISLIDARDVAAVAAAVLREGSRHAGERYELTGPEALSFADIAAHLGAATGRPVTYVDVPPEDARKAMLQRGMPEWLVANILALHADFRTGPWSGVEPAVREVTGRPARSFLDFAREHGDVLRPGPARA